MPGKQSGYRRQEARIFLNAAGWLHKKQLISGSLVSIIARDLEAVDKDITIRENLSLNNNFLSYPHKCLEKNQYNYSIKHSFMFDHKIGEYILSPLVDFLFYTYGINKFNSYEKIKEIVHDHLVGLPEGFFPSDYCWYKFDDVLVNQEIAFRPYKKIPKPVFRDY